MSAQVRCPHCTRVLFASFGTDGNGIMVEHVEFCGCAESRRLVGLCKMCPNPATSGRRVYCSKACRDAFNARQKGYKTRRIRNVDVARRLASICQRCDKPVEGKPKVALYCDQHKRAANADAQRRHHEKVGNKHQQTFYYRHRDEILEAMREHNAKPEVRESKAQYKRDWRKKNRDKTKAQKRRHALRGHSAEVARRHKERRARGEVATPILQTRRNERGERLCIKPDCTRIVKGREKMCNQCKHILAMTIPTQRSA